MTIYYPLLRWKQGEQAALQNLTSVTKDLIAPIIEFPDNCECTENRVINFCRESLNAWGPNRPYYVDFESIDYSAVQPATVHPLLQLLNDARSNGLVIVPIITTDIDPTLLSVFSQAFRSGYIHNAALRVFRDEETSSHLDAVAATTEIGLDSASCDLIIDLGDVSGGQLPSNLRVLRSLVSQFGTNYRRIILVSGGFDPAVINTDSNGRIRRNDYDLWMQARLIPEMSHLQFGDYATVQAELIEVQYQGAPKIKYTLDHEWYVVKGHRSRARDNQRQQLSRHIAGQAFYRGNTYSYGDQRIMQCANGTWGPGNSTQWVSIDVNQHITFVVNQVSATLGVI